MGRHRGADVTREQKALDRRWVVRDDDGEYLTTRMEWSPRQRDAVRLLKIEADLSATWEGGTPVRLVKKGERRE